MHVADIETLLTPDRLTAALEKACAKRVHGRVALGLFSGEVSATAVIAPGRVDAQSAASVRTITGCVAKGLTAALASQVIVEGGMTLDQPITGLLPDASAQSVLRGITVRQLLNHTHGIDLSDQRVPPRGANGFIDVEELYRLSARHPCIASPGELYSYGNAGSWFTAAILERHYGETYENLLVSRIFDPLGIQPMRDPRYPKAFCPAVGGSLMLSVDDLMKLLRWQMESEQARVLPGRPHSLPGWALEHGASLGWKYYGDDWFGHNALVSDASAVVRFNIARRAGIAIVAEDRSAALVLARVFGTALPELRDLRLPRVLIRHTTDALPADVRAGSYANAGTLVALSAGESSGYVIEIVDRRDGADVDAPPLLSTLQPCTGGAFMLEPHAAGFGTWIQFTHDGDYLWNGKELLRRQLT